MVRTQRFRRSDQLLVSWAGPHKGRPVTKQRLSHWVVEAIALTYLNQGLQPPEGSACSLHPELSHFVGSVQGAGPARDLCCSELVSVTHFRSVLHAVRFRLMRGTAGSSALIWSGSCLLVGGRLISLSGIREAAISHSETSSDVLCKRP